MFLFPKLQIFCSLDQPIFFSLLMEKTKRLDKPITNWANINNYLWQINPIFSKPKIYTPLKWITNLYVVTTLLWFIPTRKICVNAHFSPFLKFISSAFFLPLSKVIHLKYSEHWSPVFLRKYCLLITLISNFLVTFLVIFLLESI